MATSSSTRATCSASDTSGLKALHDGGGPITARRIAVVVLRPGRALAIALAASFSFLATSSKAESTTPPDKATHRLAYELRGHVVGILSAPKTYELSGTCLTGTGTAPVSIYGQKASARAYGAGVGLGLRGGYLYMPSPDPSARFPVWALRAGAGIDIDYVYAQVPLGMSEVSGELCTTVQKRSHPVNTESGSMLLLQFPLQLGGHIGIGRFHDGSTFRGIVVGAAWAPSLTHFEPPAGARSTELRWLGAEMTLDFVDLEAQAATTNRPAVFRISASLTPPSRRGEPLVFTLGLGAAWY